MTASARLSRKPESNAPLKLDIAGIQEDEHEYLFRADLPQPKPFRQMPRWRWSGTIRWTIGPLQAVIAHLLGCHAGRVRIVAFNGPAYAAWLAGRDDSEALRAAWAAGAEAPLAGPKP